MGEIVWLASYPKSGNTWTRAFLTNYLDDDVASDSSEFDINRLDGGPISSNRPLFDQAVGVEASCLLPEEIDNLRAASFRILAGEQAKTHFIKTHEAWRRAPSGEALFPADVSRGVVYIVRNPLDVVISSTHHFVSTHEQVVAHLNDEDHTLSRYGSALKDQLEQTLRSWSGHVHSWLDEAPLPHYLMRYEDMLINPVDCFGKMVQFAGLAYDQAKVEAAVQACSFEVLRRQESSKGFRERPVGASAPFFREGRAGSWRTHLPPNLAERIVEAHAETMHRLGYLDAQGNLLV